MGSPTSSSGPSGANQGAGASYVVFGRDTAQTGPFPAGLALSGLDGTHGFRVNGVLAGDLSGSAVSGAGDINGDGVADLLIGANRVGPNDNNSGASYVVFGRQHRPGPLSGEPRAFGPRWHERLSPERRGR